MKRYTHNPYYSVAGIDNPNLFFGRSNDIEVLLNALFSGSPQCYSIVGQRKIGKTSLVQHLFRPTTIQKFGLSPDDYLFVYLDCQRHIDALKSTGNFYAELLNQLRSTMPDDLADAVLVSPAGSDDASAEWERVLRELGARGFYVIVVFDEFEKAIIQESLITGGLFGSLRGVAQASSNFAWLTCSKLFLHDLFEEAFDEYRISHVKRKSESDFYNIAPPRSLGLFAERSDTLKLVASPSEQHGVNFSPEDIEAIISFGGDFPYFIQRACYHFFNAYLDGTVQRESLLRLCVRESIQLWEGFWNKLSTRQQVLLFSIASDQQVEAGTFEIESLKDTALVYEDSNKDLLPFSQEFGRFIRAKSREMQSKGTTPLSPPEEVDTVGEAELTIQELITQGESEHLEFKATLRWNVHQNKRDKLMEYIVAKTLSGFMNKEGGTLIIGADDDGNVVGLECDFATLRKKNPDGFELALIDAVKTCLGIEYLRYIRCRFELVEGKWICIVKVDRSHEAVYVTHGNKREFWVRMGNSTQQLDVKEAINYVNVHWSND